MSAAKTKVKTGGRVKGTPNKKTDDFFDRCKELDHDVIAFNILVAQNKYKELGYPAATVTVYTKSGDSYEQDVISIETRLAANNRLLDFMYPKRKAVEHSVNNESKGVFTLNYSDAKLRDDSK